MPPNATSEVTGVLNEEDAETIDGGLTVEVEKLKRAGERRISIVWRNVILFAYLHAAALYGGWLAMTSAKWRTLAFAGLLYLMSALGITAGAHRLWAHRSYKAKLPLRIILAVFNTIAFQDAAMDWARDHRVHHKYSETDADPHNATRGFFFSHVGWLLCRKHPDVIAKGKQIDLSDLKADPVLRFQKKYYLLLMPIACFLVPTMVPWYFWGESLRNAWFVCALFRYAVVLNVTWLVNSAAHKWGDKPFDLNISPAQNPSVAIFALGEGWHNYHHVFPWDYKTAELGGYHFNFSTAFIDFFAKIGWAYDLKSVSPEIIEKRVRRTGDGTHPLWGWGDKNQPQSEIDNAIISHHKAE
jgi:stearoyl-CoA desaturase (delta-9 desaturase)